MHRTRVSVLADVSDANNTIAGANGSDFERSGVRAVDLGAPPAGKNHERAAWSRRALV